MASASIISIAAGTMPAPMIVADRAPARLGESYAASTRCTVSATGVSLTTILVTMPSVPSEPVNVPSRS